MKSEKIGVLSLFKNIVMAKITIAMFLNWITANMVYYGLQLSSVNLSDDIYVNFMLLAVIEIPSYIFCILVSNHFHADHHMSSQIPNSEFFNKLDLLSQITLICLVRKFMKIRNHDTLLVSDFEWHEMWA